MHSEECAISLSWMVCAVPTQSPLVIVVQVRNSVRPMHLFGHNRDHDYYFELPRKGERDAQSITRCSTAHHRDVRALPACELNFFIRLESHPLRHTQDIQTAGALTCDVISVVSDKSVN